MAAMEHMAAAVVGAAVAVVVECIRCAVVAAAGEVAAVKEAPAARGAPVVLHQLEFSLLIRQPWISLIALLRPAMPVMVVMEERRELEVWVELEEVEDPLLHIWITGPGTAEQVEMVARVVMEVMAERVEAGHQSASL
jgi:hypothetical protein